MQNDDRQERPDPQDRDERPEGLDEAPIYPDSPAHPGLGDASDAEASVNPEPEEAPEEEGQEEFETASWPQQDTVRREEPASEGDDAPVEPVEQVEPVESAPSTPPPDVEAYSPVTESPPESAVPAHSVPATEPGESTRCPRCGTENRPGISFCRSCGQRLVAAGAPATVARPAPPEGTQACPRCGTHNRAGVAFCQNCGANLRAAPEGYVPPSVSQAPTQPAEQAEIGRALLGPIVLLVGAIGIVTGWLLPFKIGQVSLFDQTFGTSGGYGIAFWNGIDQGTTVAQQAYFGLAAAAPLLALLLLVLAIAGFLRPAPGALQLGGLVVSLLWAIGLVVLFLVVEAFGGPGGDFLDLLRNLSPGGIIFLLASLIVLIGGLTRLGRS